MPGRQAHGRSLTAAPKTKANNRSKARSQKNALDAFGIAQQRFSSQPKKTPRSRGLDVEVEKKHGREDEDGEDGEMDEEDEDDEPRRKKVKRQARPAGDEDAEFGSDSEGNEWQLGGMAEDDEDSEIESDDAFGDSDDDKFQGYSFRGSKPKDDDSEDDENDDEGETLGEDAIDLATALDQYEEESDEVPEGGSASDSDASTGSDDSESEESEGSVSDEDDEDAEPERLEALQGIISGYGGEASADKDKPFSKAKIELSDLGLSGINDPFMKQSVKLLNKEDKEKRPGQAKKLEVPLARRQQARLDRAAAYDKTNETLDKWTDTVKHNRRAEHLIFPLAQNSESAGLDRTELQPFTGKDPSNELESTIMSIMDQSGLSMESKKKEKPQEFDEEGNLLSRKEAANKKRLEREMISREAKRAKRIKKIKSKAYHRVHRKQRERDDMATREAMEEAGEIDSEEEREAQDRRRALERVGQRHKESKWAKMGSKAKRAVWDDEYRAGLTDMARRDEELRRRKEGRTDGDSDDTSSSGSDSEEGDDALRRKLDDLEGDDEAPQQGLMGMKFMQKAEAAKRAANDAMIKQIRRDLDGEDGAGSEEEQGDDVGRKQYGAAGTTAFGRKAMKARMEQEQEEDDEDDEDAVITVSKPGKGSTLSNSALPNIASSAHTAAPVAGAWSTGESRKKKKHASAGSRIEDLDVTSNVLVASKPKANSKPKATTQPSTQLAVTTHDSDSDSDAAETHLPLAIRDQDLIARAFAGEDVVGDFTREKEAIAAEDDDKVFDSTLPGWGSWVGEGVSKREMNRHKGRFLTKVEGVKKRDRKDAKLDKVIINEKRIKKNDRYLASQLPHPFESKQQYERSLRIPVGPEWTTKETFQDSTKPRVIVKQGVITPIAKPIR